jgi:endonuclease-3
MNLYQFLQFMSCLIIIRSIQQQIVNKNVWKSQWAKIEELRTHTKAEIDIMGAEALSKTTINASDSEFRFQTLLATMLSPQTKDLQTSIAFNNLIQLVHPKSLTPKNLLLFDVNQIENAIKNVSFYKIKSKNILEASYQCANKYNNDIPTRFEDLLAFSGIGPKIAYLTSTIAYNKTLGINYQI